jgi:hypothetical protein
MMGVGAAPARDTATGSPRESSFPDPTRKSPGNCLAATAGETPSTRKNGKGCGINNPDSEAFTTPPVVLFGAPLSPCVEDRPTPFSGEFVANPISLTPGASSELV